MYITSYIVVYFFLFIGPPVICPLYDINTYLLVKKVLNIFFFLAEAFGKGQGPLR